MTGPSRTDATHHVVIGAGPAGLVAAMSLARSGLTVRVLERSTEVGHRFAGDFQGLENWTTPRDSLESLASLGIEAEFDHAAFHEVTFHDRHLDSVVVRSHGRPLFHLIRRGPGDGSLDRSLLEQARSAGARVDLGVRSDHAGPGTIIATGPAHADGLVVGMVFPTKLENQARCIISDRLSPAGYAYLLAWNGQATLATCLFRSQTTWRKARDSTVEAFVKVLPALRADLAHARPFSGHGSVFPSPRFMDEAGRLFIGEAAGLQDAEWGFGLKYAMESGALAAGSLIDGFDYGRAAVDVFVPRMRTAFANRLMFEALPEAVLPLILRRGAASADLHDRLRRHCAPWPPKSVLSAVARRWLARSRLDHRDVSCHDHSCRCIRCMCGRPSDSDRLHLLPGGRYGRTATKNVAV